nr:ABC transporter G family member 1-like isoform X3 [Ziziphus jujuba var. spinosa]
MANNLEIRAALEMERVNYNNNNNNNNNNHDKVVEEGVCLTWEDLWVTVSKGRTSSKAILQGLTGHAKPGELMAIMGPSGCGKSTLLDALAGRLSSKTRQSGDILINGRKETLAYGTSAYVTQDDTLITTLTVSEAVYYSAQLQLSGSMSKSEKKERAEMTIREMGLQDAMNTRIGGWGCKGLSGGQKRRVSICIEILTHPKLLFLDEPTSGLDSAASYHVMSGIASLDQRDGSRRTIIASIHQPSSEVFQLFSSLCLLSSGKTVYFGPAARANEDIEQGSGGAISTEEVINTLIKSYKASETYQQVRREIAEISKKDYGAVEKERNHASFLTQSVVLTRRSFINMFRDLGYYWLRLAIYVALSLGLGTLYLNVGFTNESIQARGSLIMFIVSFLTFMAIGGFPSFVEDMKVFERERLNGHYGAAAFMMGNTFSGVPYLLIISVIPGSLAYFLPGLQEGNEHFFYFFCVIFACMMLVESLMMIIASLVPNYLMGIIAGAGVQGLMILGGGFFRLPGDLPKEFWRYPLHYIAFHRFAYQGMFKNEFEGLTFPNNEVGGRPTISGEEILRNKWQVDMGHSKWVDLGILLGMIAFYRILFLVIIKTSEKLKTVNLGKLMAMSPKQSIQVIENPIATPMHGDQINNHQY